MKERYITITGFNHYFGKRPFKIGNVLKCKKEPENIQDMEAIKVMLPYIGTVGYIANSPYTVAGGTMSAGRIYDQVKKKFYVRVLFTTSSKIICKIEDAPAGELECQIMKQMKEEFGDEDWE